MENLLALSPSFFCGKVTYPHSEPLKRLQIKGEETSKGIMCGRIPMEISVFQLQFPRDRNQFSSLTSLLEMQLKLQHWLFRQKHRSSEEM